MPEAGVNGVTLYYELHGDGDPLVLVHGSWTDATSWAFVLPRLAESFRVLAYDRRGHSRSERPDTPGSVDEDGDDLEGLLQIVDFAPAHVVTNSYGGNIALRLATRRPDLFRSLTCHEPPLWSLLEDHAGSREALEANRRSLERVAARIAGGDHEGAARLFVDEVAFGPGAWESEIPPEVKEVFVRNAPTFLDEIRDPDQLRIYKEALSRLDLPVRFTEGPDSPSIFPHVIDRLEELIPGGTRETVQGAAHVPHLTAPAPYAEGTMRWVRSASNS